MPQGMTAIPPSKLDGLKPSSLGELGQRSSGLLSSRSLALIDGGEIFATSVPRALCHFAIKQLRSRCGNFRPLDLTRAIERGRNWK